MSRAIFCVLFLIYFTAESSSPVRFVLYPKPSQFSKLGKYLRKIETGKITIVLKNEKAYIFEIPKRKRNFCRTIRNKFPKTRCILNKKFKSSNSELTRGKSTTHSTHAFICPFLREGMVPGLTLDWSKRYVGSDLAKEFLKENGYNRQIPVGIVDEKMPANFPLRRPDALSQSLQYGGATNFGNCSNHGICVANLMGSPRFGHSNNSTFSMDYDYSSDGLSLFLDNFPEAKSNDIDPWVVNNSWNQYYNYKDGQWTRDPIDKSANRTRFLELKKMERDSIWQVKKYYNYLYKNKVVPVLSIGNNYPAPGNLENLNLRRAIAVGNLSPDGLAAFTSQESNKLVILAPGDQVTSGAQRAEVFSGSSAASPIVSAAVVDALAIFGIKIPIAFLKKLIEKTAIQNINTFEAPRINGAGILNHYQLVRAADHIKKRCSQKNPYLLKACILFGIQTFSQSKISSKSADGSNVDSYECLRSHRPANLAECSKLEDQEKKLRIKVLLDSKTPEHWSNLECLYGENQLWRMESYAKLQKELNTPTSDLRRRVDSLPDKNKKSLIPLLPEKIQNLFFRDGAQAEGVHKIVENFLAQKPIGERSSKEISSFFQDNQFSLRSYVYSRSSSLSILFSRAKQFQDNEVINRSLEEYDKARKYRPKLRLRPLISLPSHGESKFNDSKKARPWTPSGRN